MNRRALLTFLALGPFFRHAHAQPKTMKGIKDMQDNWKTLLAALVVSVIVIVLGGRSKGDAH